MEYSNPSVVYREYVYPSVKVTVSIRSVEVPIYCAEYPSTPEVPEVPEVPDVPSTPEVPEVPVPEPLTLAVAHLTILSSPRTRYLVASAIPDAVATDAVAIARPFLM
jgi:hypothetical protein